MHMM